jgi:hypothetical protein
VYNCVYANIDRRVSYKFTGKERFAGGTKLSRGHDTNKHIQVWLTDDPYEQLELFLNKFSDGESFSGQAHWAV